MQHISGAQAELPTPVTGSYEIEEGWNELGALLKFNRMSTPLADMFPKDVVASFLTHRAYESMSVVLAGVLAEVADEEGQAAEVAMAREVVVAAHRPPMTMPRRR